MHLFMQPKEESEEIWYGYRSGLDAGSELFGADETHDISTLPSMITKLTSSAEHVYFDTTIADELAGSRAAEIKTALEGLRCTAISPLVHRLRLIKSDAEVELMRRVGQISGRAYVDAMRQPWTSESALQAELRHGWVRHGAQREAYVPVVAGGARAGCIHYTQNNQLINDQDMIFVDAGAELGGYLTDISRAWPASGKFAEPQRDLYQAVLNVEKACVRMCTANSGHSIQTIHNESVELMKMELRNLGFSLVEGDIERFLYPHRVGHHIGLEIHDCASLGGFESLAENQTITIEPGCYVPDDEQWPKHFRGLALRIEDSIAVGKEVPTILSVEAVKEIVDIEALRQ